MDAKEYYSKLIDRKEEEFDDYDMHVCRVAEKYYIARTKEEEIHQGYTLEMTLLDPKKKFDEDSLWDSFIAWCETNNLKAYGILKNNESNSTIIDDNLDD